MLAENEIRPFLQAIEQETLPGKIAPVMRINAVALFSADRALYSHEFTSWLDRYIRPIVRIGSSLEPGQPEESLALCWNAATGARCHADLAIVHRTESAIVSVCPKCACMTLIDFWQATPWNTLDDE